MLARDHRPVTRQPQANSEDSAGARGATAFQWSKQLTYQESTHQADMVGDVLVVHQDDNSAQSPVRMTCQHVIAWFEPAPRRVAPGPTTRKNSEGQSGMQLHYLTAEGGTVTVTRDTDQMIARQVDYDPARHVLIATGTEQNPVNFSTGGTGGGTAERVEWDTITWKMKTSNAIFDYRPATPPTGVQLHPGKTKPATRSSR
jgi:hypothetical protein